MVSNPFAEVVRELRGLAGIQPSPHRTDADLWAAYVQKHDQDAFETLLRRHGPMVLGVCRRILRNQQDAEDAFQATFLVLVRKAASLRSPSAIASWLHGVASRTALEARSAAAKRLSKERMVPTRTFAPEDNWNELPGVLDEEIGRLGGEYRTVVILCELEGKSRREAARVLGWAEGTVASRLSRGKKLLAKRLTRRGFSPCAIAATFASAHASSCLHLPKLMAPLAAACSSGAGGMMPNNVLAPRVIAITEGVMRSMFFTKIKSAVALFLCLGMVSLGVISRTGATEFTEGHPIGQEKSHESTRDVHDRLAKLKSELQQMQKEIARLEKETRARGGASETLSGLFKYKIEFDTGFTESHEGGRIEIREVWGTRPKIEVGGQYIVRGKYVLPKGQRGKLYFYVTASGNWGQDTATLDLQTVEVDKPEGEFVLVHGMAGPGYFHLYLADRERYSRTFANVYFGTGDTVWRKKP